METPLIFVYNYFLYAVKPHSIWLKKELFILHTIFFFKSRIALAALLFCFLIQWFFNLLYGIPKPSEIFPIPFEAIP